MAPADRLPGSGGLFGVRITQETLERLHDLHQRYVKGAHNGRRCVLRVRTDSRP